MLIKAGLQLQLQQILKKKKAGEVLDFLQFDWSNKKLRAERWEAFLLYPLFYSVPIEPTDKEEVVRLKKGIKRIHIAIFSLLIVLILIGVYTSKSAELQP